MKNPAAPQPDPRYIDLTPTWVSAMNILCVVLESGTANGKALARAELQRVAHYLDSLQDRTTPMPVVLTEQPSPARVEAPNAIR